MTKSWSASVKNLDNEIIQVKTKGKEALGKSRSQ